MASNRGMTKLQVQCFCLAAATTLIQGNQQTAFVHITIPDTDNTRRARTLPRGSLEVKKTKNALWMAPNNVLFQSNGSSSRIRERCNNRNGPLHVMKDQDVSTSSNTTFDTSSVKEKINNEDEGSAITNFAEEELNSIMKEENPWWKTFQLEDEALAFEVRDQFPILQTASSDENKPLIYLDSAATSQKPLYVTDALTKYYHTTNSNVHRGAHRLSREATNQYEDARDTIAQLVNAYSRNEIVYTSGATEAINLVAYSWARLNLKEGDEIITTVAEHHSNLVPWQMIAKETGATVRYVPLKTTEEDGDFLDWDAYRKELFDKDKTKLVAFQHASNVLGMANPVKEIVEWTKEQNPNCMILLDACQSVPHQPVDVQDLGIDFMAVSGHKMCGPTGIGFLWGKEDILNKMEPFMGGGEMIQDVTLNGSTYAPAPGRFEAGTPQIAQAIGLGAAVRYLTSIKDGGMERITKYEHELGQYMQRRLEELEGVRVFGPKVGPKRTAICTFVVNDVHPSDLSTFLDVEGVAVRAGHHCCQPLHAAFDISHSARASCYFYNTKEDIDIFIEKLEETISFFRSIRDSENEGGFF